MDEKIIIDLLQKRRIQLGEAENELNQLNSLTMKAVNRAIGLRAVIKELEDLSKEIIKTQ